MAKLLVTGASGFLGHVVASRLAELRHDVVGLDLLPAPDAPWRHVIDDLSSRARLVELQKTEAFTHVIHCGGVSGPMVMADDPAAVIDVNVTGSINLLQAALQGGAKSFLYCSSVSAVGNFYETTPIGDDHPLRPTTTYGCSKAAMDMVLRGLWKRVPLDLCALRFTTVYGPGRRTVATLDAIVAAAMRGETVTVEPTSDWPYVYIDDAADAVIAACFSNNRRQLHYFIAFPEQVTLEQLAELASRDGGGGTALLHVDTSRPPISRGSLDIAPARRDFGFAPKIDYRTGIRRLVDALAAQH
jgi:UDP-glucose 4-epimerase